MFALKAMAIEGIQTGTLAEAREVLDLARTDNFAFPPVSERPLIEAQAALETLQAGNVVGRLILKP